ncbi:MAG: ATP-binding cassette domain-containing protein [Longimicrobiales bacterium]
MRIVLIFRGYCLQALTLLTSSGGTTLTTYSSARPTGAARERTLVPRPRGDESSTETVGFAVHDVSFRVEDRTLLEVSDLSFPGGRVSGLIGPNGAGKTTLLKLLARQSRPTTGTVKFDGEPLPSWGSREFARRVAYLPQEPPEATGLTVEELVALGRYPWHGALGRFEAVDQANVDEAMRRTDLVRFADRLVETLSGGERQRVWLAMLVAQDADFLLLDEPTSALDVAQQIEVMRLIRSLSHDKGLGVVVVLHDVNVAARFCDRLVALEGGELVAEGRPTELMDDDVLGDIYGVKMGVLRHPSRGYPISFVR